MNALLCREYADRVIENVSRAIVGKQDVIRKVLITYLAGGHVLREDVPAPSFDREALLANAPTRTGSGVTVPKTFE